MLRWAVLGTSFISHTVAGAIGRSPGSVATVVVGRDAVRLETFRATHGIGRSYRTVEEAVTDSNVDAVYIGLPNHLHHEATMVAAAAGKAVLSEKSLTVSMEQTDLLLDAVLGQVFFVEGLMYLAHPLIQRFVDVLTDGRLGRMTAVHASYAANIAHLVNPRGGGAIFNLGCYPASLLQLVVDTVHGDATFDRQDLAARGRISPDGNVGEAVASVVFDVGVLANVHTAETYGMAHRFEVHGTNGVLAFNTNPWLPKPGVTAFSWTPFEGVPEDFAATDPLDAFDHQVRMVEQCVAQGRFEAVRPCPRLQDSRALMIMLTNWESRARG